MTLVAIAQSFSMQSEATKLYPYLVNPTPAGAAAFLGSVYANIFHRAIDAAGEAYWMAQLAGRDNVGRVVLDMISGAQGNDRMTVSNTITIGVEYAEAFETAQKVWTRSDLTSSLSVLVDVAFDLAAVVAAEAKICEIFNPTPTPAPTPTPTPTPPASMMALNVAGDAVALAGTNGTITLVGVDREFNPASSYDTVNKAVASGIDHIYTTESATLSAAGLSSRR